MPDSAGSTTHWGKRLRDVRENPFPLFVTAEPVNVTTGEKKRPSISLTFSGELTWDAGRNGPEPVVTIELPASGSVTARIFPLRPTYVNTVGVVAFHDPSHPGTNCVVVIAVRLRVIPGPDGHEVHIQDPLVQLCINTMDPTELTLWGNAKQLEWRLASHQTEDHRYGKHLEIVMAQPPHGRSLGGLIDDLVKVVGWSERTPFEWVKLIQQLLQHSDCISTQFRIVLAALFRCAQSN